MVHRIYHFLPLFTTFAEKPPKTLKKTKRANIGPKRNILLNNIICAYTRILPTQMCGYIILYYFMVLDSVILILITG